MKEKHRGTEKLTANSPSAEREQRGRAGWRLNLEFGEISTSVGEQRGWPRSLADGKWV